MKPTIVQLNEMQVAGLQIRTSNEAERQGKGEIGELWQRYYREGHHAQTPHQTEPGFVLGVYSNYESDETGSYSLLVGVEVEKGRSEPEGLTVVTIPAATYAVFTTRKGPVVEVVQEAWGQIWDWSKKTGNKRTFSADFERYDGKRCANPQEAQVDLYIAIEANELHP